MYGFFDYAKSKYNSLPSREAVYSTIKKTVIQTAALGQLAYNSIDSEGLIQKWEGLTRMFDPANFTFFFREQKVRTVFKRTMWANLVFMAPVLTYEIFKYCFYENVYDPEHSTDNSYSAYTAYLAACAINTGINILFSPSWVNMSVDDTLNNINIAAVVSEENSDPEHKKTCGCKNADIIFAGLASPTLFLIDMSVLWMLERALPLGKYLTYPGRVLLNGRALTEFNLSKMCTKHRNEILAKNNSYSLGLGLAYQVTVESIYWMTGMNSKFIYDPLSYMVFQAFIMISLLNNKPLPGKKVEMDFLYYFHTGMGSLLNQISKGILSYLNTERGGCDFLAVPINLERMIPPITQPNEKLTEKDLVNNVSQYLLKNLDKLAGKSKSAYVFTQDEYLFYIDKLKQTCTYIKLSHDQLRELKAALKISATSFEKKEISKCFIEKLSLEQLQSITAITDHITQLDWEKLAQKIANYPPVDVAINYLIDEKYRSIESAVRVPSIKLFLDLNAAGIRATIQEIRDKRSATWTYAVKSFLEKYTPAGYEGTRSLLQVVLNKKLEPALDRIEKLLDAHKKYVEEIRDNISKSLTKPTVKVTDKWEEQQAYKEPPPEPLPEMSTKFEPDQLKSEMENVLQTSITQKDELDPNLQETQDIEEQSDIQQAEMKPQLNMVFTEEYDGIRRVDKYSDTPEDDEEIPELPYSEVIKISEYNSAYHRHTVFAEKPTNSASSKYSTAITQPRMASQRQGSQ